MTYDSFKLDTPPRFEGPDYEEDEDMPIGSTIETVPLDVPGVGECIAVLYQTTSRRSGRRIAVYNRKSPTPLVPIFDTDDCYDMGNARNSLERWLAERQAANAVPIAGALADPAGFVAGMTETRATHGADHTHDTGGGPIG